MSSTKRTKQRLRLDAGTFAHQGQCHVPGRPRAVRQRVHRQTSERRRRFSRAPRKKDKAKWGKSSEYLTGKGELSAHEGAGARCGARYPRATVDAI
eukprot:9256726-Pyramimonas_sp.AAC.1